MAKGKTKVKSKPPAKQGGRVGPNLPPIEHRFKPGQSGNPAGRKPGGLFIQEWLNLMIEQDLTEKQLLRIIRSKNIGCQKKFAAIELLSGMQRPDLADFEKAATGATSLAALRRRGVDTSVVKKLRTATEDSSGSIELHERSGDAFDRIMDRTVGRPKQEVKLSADDVLRDAAKGAVEAADLLAGIQSRLHIEPGRTDADPKAH